MRGWWVSRCSEQLVWPLADAARAVLALAQARAFCEDAARSTLPRRRAASADSNFELDEVAATVGFEADPIDVPVAELARSLPAACPALIGSGDGRDGLLVVERIRGRTATLVTGDGSRCCVPLSDLGAELRFGRGDRLEHLAAEVAGAANIPSERRRELIGALVERGREHEMFRVWRLRERPAFSWKRRPGDSRVGWRVGLAAAAQAGQAAAWILSWAAVGRGALAGVNDSGWLVAWALLLATMIGLESAGAIAAGDAARRVGVLLKRCFLVGALEGAPDDVRSDGVGRQLARLLEAEAIENLALAGAIPALFASLALLTAGAVLAASPGGGELVVLLSAFVLLTVGIAWVCWRRTAGWTDRRLDLTNRHIERLLGNRTRLVQERRDRRHRDEDEDLSALHLASAKLCRAEAWLESLVPRAWLTMAMLALAPRLVTGGENFDRLAVAVGGVLLAYAALSDLTASFRPIAAALVSWERAAPIARATAKGAAGTHRDFANGEPDVWASAGDRRPLVELDAVSIRHPGRRVCSLENASLEIRKGDRIVVEGPAGSGKSTLAAVVAGSRMPDAGVVLLSGLDHSVVGHGRWRRHVSLAPQNHQNHIFSNTLAFNLLMGRRWPPDDDDLVAASRLCEAIGLGSLLDRMPRHLMETVGEAGWQLSQGERSRVFLARALLRRADVVVLDETLTALDAATRRRCLDCLGKEAATWMLIAHR